MLETMNRVNGAPYPTDQFATATVPTTAPAYSRIQVKFDSKFKDSVGFIDQVLRRQCEDKWSSRDVVNTTLASVEKELMPLYLRILILRAGIKTDFKKGEVFKVDFHYNTATKRLTVEMLNNSNNWQIEISYTRMFMIDDFLKLGSSIEAILSLLTDEHFEYVPDKLKDHSRLYTEWRDNGIYFTQEVTF